MGLISLPIMLRYGYDRRMATGIIAASGTLAQIIPPSLVLIVMADQLGKSVGDMYEGAFIPGLVLAGLYAGVCVPGHTGFPQGSAWSAAGGDRLSRERRQPWPGFAGRAVRRQLRLRLVHDAALRIAWR